MRIHSLSETDRERFASWLEQEAEQGAIMIKLMEENKMPAVLIQKEKSEALAAKIIASKLRSIESMPVG